MYYILISLLIIGCTSETTQPPVSNKKDVGIIIKPDGSVTYYAEVVEEQPSPTQDESMLANCIDQDGDGHGQGCPAGPDCDDTNPHFFETCPDCEKTQDPGCPCEVEGMTSSCFSKAWVLVGVGICKAGTKTCKDGYWSQCVGEVLPVTEECDKQDNDCDGQTDEGFPPNCLECKDNDKDGYGQGCDDGPDCDDMNPTVHENCPVCIDNDKDGYGDGCALGPDCDDMNPGYNISCPKCIDNDGDGYGTGCSLGGDCDDNNPKFHVNCPNCAAEPQEGCKCATEGQTKACFSGDWGLVGKGVCQAGKRVCKDGFWGACIGEVLPTKEVCDLKDNDCDGKIDEDFPQGCNVVVCQDQDGDGYGVNCPKGLDCDDTNPNFYNNCPKCGKEPIEGCPCPLPNESVPCFSGNKALIGVGECKAGVMTCTNGFWSVCFGEVPPMDEFCDLKDNDCDGFTDEGVKSECGNCDPNCHVVTIGPQGDQKFNPNVQNSSQGVILTPEGWLTLAESAFSLHFIWIANSGESTVSKLDTVTGKELGRYKVCSDPSRTTVGLDSDGWAACRGDGKVVKIKNITEKCPDKNGNGIIETSKDLNGDGTIQSNEMVANDECILFYSQPEGQGAIARALGVDKDNHAWAGFWNPKTLHRLDPKTGASVQKIQLPANPYGLAIDSKGIIWVSGRGGGLLVSADPKTGQVKTYSPGAGYSPYGIAVDEFDRVWTPTYTGSTIWVYNPANGQWKSVNAHNNGRGVASNRKGYVFVANDSSNEIAKIDEIGIKVVGYASLGSGHHPIGVAIDSDGFVWTVNQSASSACKIDPDTLQVKLEKKVGQSPYTYSDMTGSFFFKNIVPEGYYRLVFEGPDLDPYMAEWYEVVWETISVEYESPEGTYIEVRARSADTKEALAQSQWSQAYGPCPPKWFPVTFETFMGGASKGRKWLEVEIAMYSSEKAKPIVRKIEIQYGTKWKG